MLQRERMTRPVRQTLYEKMLNVTHREGNANPKDAELWHCQLGWGGPKPGIQTQDPCWKEAEN